jgi:hypothetical protein
MKQILLNEQEDCQWLKEVHLNNKKYHEFKCFVLYGNEDNPVITDVHTVLIFD